MGKVVFNLLTISRVSGYLLIYGADLPSNALLLLLHQLQRNGISVVSLQKFSLLSFKPLTLVGEVFAGSSLLGINPIKFSQEMFLNVLPLPSGNTNSFVDTRDLLINGVN
ncbi:hypothetical protein [Corynebacterium matruchotii]|uniref:hypothetical protein n=1 Tax=Corynebacterium matruchotii TaxID=43768 RepID=UPI0005532AC6|nr:hypothetical protein [Corynebacterium matruchotii]